MSRARTKGFTLIELLVAVGLMTVLASLAFFGYRDKVIDSRRRDAQADLLELHQFMEKTFTENFSYMPGGSAPALPFTQSPSQPGSSKFYDLSLQTLTADTFVLLADPTASQEGNGNLLLSNTGVEKWDKNNDGDYADASENNW